MKIAFLTSEYPHAKTGHSGGIGTSIKNLAAALVNQGASVRILIYGQNKDEVFEENGIVFHLIKNIKLKGFSWYLTRKKIQKIINSLYDSKQIELVEAPDWTGITSFIKTKCPIVIRENGSDTYFCHLDDRKVKPVNRYHEKRALKKADAVLSVSDFTGELTNRIFGLDKPYKVIPNGIDVSHFKNSGEHYKPNTILYFGSLIRKKGLLDLPMIFNKVIEKNPSAKLILIGKDVPDIKTGNPSTWEMMRKLFSEQALSNTDYQGSVSYDKIKASINEAAVCVFPSYAEALPVSWLEAMAMKKAIVASNIGWANEMIDDGKHGFLVHPESHQQFATQINLLLQNQDLNTAFGEAAKRRVDEKFAIDIITKQNMEFYDSIILRTK